ncbi:MAG: hypothetical protein J5J00_11910 [Deltaproteobacteria bacterium]|nr:hypothetical protein [Deltaproteobacteria bacterium]
MILREKVAAIVLASAGVVGGFKTMDSAQSSGNEVQTDSSSTGRAWRDAVLVRTQADQHIIDNLANHHLVEGLGHRNHEAQQIITEARLRSAETLRLSSAALSRQQSVSESFQRLEADLEATNRRLSLVTGRMAQLEERLTLAISNGSAIQGDLHELARETFDEFYKHMRHFIDLTNNQIANLDHFSLDQQLDQLAVMYQRSKSQAAMAARIYVLLRSSKLLDSGQTDLKFEKLTDSYYALIDQSADLMEKRIEISKEQFCSAMADRGVSRECSEFYYSKCILLSILDLGVKELPPVAEKLGITAEELRDMRPVLADLSFQDFKQSLAGTAKSEDIARVAGVFSKYKTLGNIFVTVLKIPSSERQESFQEVSEKYTEKCINGHNAKIMEQLRKDINECLGISDEDAQSSLSPMAPEITTGPTITAAPNGKLDPATQQCIDQARARAAEAMVAATRQCCRDYSDGSVEQCKEHGVMSPRSALLDNLCGQDLSKAESRAVRDEAGRHGHQCKSGDGASSGDCSGPSGASDGQCVAN